MYPWAIVGVLKNLYAIFTPEINILYWYLEKLCVFFLYAFFLNSLVHNIGFGVYFFFFRFSRVSFFSSFLHYKSINI